MATLWDIIRQTFGTRDSLIVHDIHSTRQMSVLLKRERQRTDRSHRPFSLVVVDIDLTQQYRYIHEFAEQLITRIRDTDELGWIGKDRLGVLLPETTDEGAMIVANCITSLATAPQAVVKLSIYTYPSPNWVDVDPLSSDVPEAPGAKS